MFGGTPSRAVRRLIEAAEIYVSPPLLEEYRAVPHELRTSGKITGVQLADLLFGVASFVVGAKVVTPTARLTVCRDPGDDILLECCRAANANYLTTGDRDLLEIPTTDLENAGLSRLEILTSSATLRALV